MNNRIAIIFEEDYLGSYPSFVEAIKMFSEDGFKVDILGTLRESRFPDPPKFNENVSLHLLPIKNVINRDYKIDEGTNNPTPKSNPIPPRSSYIKKIIPENLKKIVRSIRGNIHENINEWSFQKKFIKDQLNYFLFVLKHVRKNKYDTIIGIDLGGGGASYLATKIVPCRNYIYWGLEISNIKQALWALKLYKFLECKACQVSNAVLTTDDARAKDVCAENQVDYNTKTCLCVPHSPLGFCEETKSSFFQDLFSLDNSICTILHSGWIHDVMMSKDLAATSRNWPSNWRMIFHERMKRSTEESYIRDVIEAGNEKVLMSLNPVEYDRIDEVVLSAKIGIVIYGNSEKFGNSWISLAKGSGKIAHYLRCGKPVVCMNLPGFKEIIEKYQCGVMFDSLNEIQGAVEKILDNYEFYQKNAYECYKYEYEFGRFFKNVVNFIKQ
jgi:glycosyltransferase involved in cell wall biosynthesis